MEAFIQGAVIFGQLAFFVCIALLGAFTFWRGCEAMGRAASKADTIADVLVGVLILTVCTVGALSIIIFGCYFITNV